MPRRSARKRQATTVSTATTTTSLFSLHEDLHPLIFEYLVGAKNVKKKRYVAGNNWVKFRRGLQGLPEVCRAFDVVWTLAPMKFSISAHAVNCDAAARAIRKMGGSLENFTVTVRYIYAKEDFAIFTQTMFRNSGQSLADVLPNLKKLTISPSFENSGLDPMQHKSAIMKQNPAAEIAWEMMDYGTDMFDDDSLWMFPPPSTLCDFSGLGALPPEAVLHLDRIRPSANLGSIETLNLDEVYEDSDIYFLQTTNLIEFRLNTVSCHGCSVGNQFLNVMLRHLPSSLKRLRLDSSSLFKMPYQFPSTLALEKMTISSVWFKQPSLTGLPVGLLELTLGLEDGGLEGDTTVYSFPTLDVTDLPPALTVLKISGPDSPKLSHQKKVRLVGTAWPPALVIVEVTEDVEVDEALLRCLPVGVSIGAATEEDSESWFRWAVHYY